MKTIREAIEDEESKIIRKKRFLKILKISTLILLVFLLFYLYTYFFSTKGLLVKETKIINSKISKDFRGVKIIHFSDLHYGSTFFDIETKNLVNKINKRKPDIVVFTGDLVNKNYKLDDKNKTKLIKILSNIDSKLGKYAVFGDEDDEGTKELLVQSNFKILNNSNELIHNNTNDSIRIVGIDTKENIKQAFNYQKDDKYTICILHKPDLIDNIIKDFNVDLALSGHSLNGQINIFFPLIKKDGAKKYYREHYSIKDTELYISSGLGTSYINFRLGTHPSINFFRLYNN